jgi:hypothetical protein
MRIQTPSMVDDTHDSVCVYIYSRPDYLWGPPNLQSNWYWDFFPRGLNGRGLKLTTHLQLMPRSKKVDLYIYSPIRLHGLVLN